MINNHMVNKINYIKIQNGLETKGYFVLKNFLSKSLCKNLLDKTLKKKIVNKDPGKFHQGGLMIYNLQNKDQDLPKDENQMADEVQNDDEDVISLDDILDDEEEALSPLEALEKERDGFKDQLYRAAAEMENTKRRAQRDVEQANKYGALGFMRDLTTPLDNMQRALDTAPQERNGLDETYKNILIGLEMTVQEVTKIMEKHGYGKSCMGLKSIC